MLRRLRRKAKVEFIVFDLETTGFDAKKDKIIEIGAIHYRHGGVNHKTFSALINPGIVLPSKITEITGITDDMLRGEESVENMLPKFIDFIGNHVLVAYNSDFDMRFLKKNALDLGYRIKNPIIDVLPIAREAFPGLSSYTLERVAEHLKLESQPTHRALDDCLALLQVYAATTLV